MIHRYDIGRFSVLLNITVLFLLVSLVFMPCDAADELRYSLVGHYFRIGWITGNPTLAGIASMLLLAAGPLAFFSTDRLYTLRLGGGLPLIYAILIFSCRGALCLSPIHIAVFFLAWTLLYSFKASQEQYDADNAFISMMMLSTGSLFFVPLIWMAPLVAVLDNYNSARKGKTVIGSVCGLLLPMIFVTGIHSMITGFTDIFEPVVRYASMAVDINTGLPQMQQSATVLKVLLLIIASVWATISFLSVYGTLDIAAARCHLRCLFYGVWLTLIVLVFGHSLGSAPWMLVMLPASLFLYAFFKKHTQQKAGVFLLCLLLLLIVAERIVVLL